MFFMDLHFWENDVFSLADPIKKWDIGQWDLKHLLIYEQNSILSHGTRGSNPLQCLTGRQTTLGYHIILSTCLIKVYSLIT